MSSLPLFLLTPFIGTTPPLGLQGFGWGHTWLQPEAVIARECQMVDAQYAALGWGKSPCLGIPWKYEFLSENGHPLLYWVLSSGEGDAGPTDEPPDTTLILGGVHPDEYTPIHLVFRFAQELQKGGGIPPHKTVVLAPLVNPDGFFARRPTRTNANGVDLNRNFPTQDWWREALSRWKAEKRSDPRNFPGKTPGVEQGTRFQMDLIRRFEPDKIISVHAPLGFLDYDGPGKNGPKVQNDVQAGNYVKSIAREAGNYRIQSYGFFPGSLGNYGGNERYIPTVTLELNSSDPRRVQNFWEAFAPGLKAALSYRFHRSAVLRWNVASQRASETPSHQQQ